MKKVLALAICLILIMSMASMAFAAEQNRFAYKGENGQSSGSFDPSEEEGVPAGQLIRERVQERLSELNRLEGTPPCDVDEEEEEEEEEGMPYWHGLTGREFGQMIREMAQSGPGAVAAYMHQWRFNHPTLE
jgi:hypothetical protein